MKDLRRPADADQGEWSCGAFKPEPPAFRCTRPYGHPGAHVAHGLATDEVLAVWVPTPGPRG